MSEFGAAFCLLVLVIIWPLLNLTCFACGAAVVYLITNQSATRAANAITYSAALQEVLAGAKSIETSGLANFAKISPEGGLKHTGVDLYIVVTEISSNHVTAYGPNQPYQGAIDRSRQSYRYLVRTSFAASPLLRIPGMDKVPILGKDLLLSFSSERTIEHPDNLSQ